METKNRSNQELKEARADKCLHDINWRGFFNYLTSTQLRVKLTPSTITTNGEHMSLTINAWREKRACAGMATANFFPQTRGIAKKTIAVCDECPVKWDCLNYAVINGIEHGIWGGTTESQRIHVIRAYQKLAGRPEPAGI